MDAKYCAILVFDNGNTILLTLNTPEELAEELSRYFGRSVKAFPYYGTSLAISRGPRRRYLLDHTGKNYPLFQEDEVLEPDPTGSLLDYVE